MSNIHINGIQGIVSKHEPTLQLMHQHAIAHSHKIARQVYNRQSRNIAQFIREQRIFNKKMAQKPLFFGNNNNIPKRKRFGVTLRYEENERLQLSFDRNTFIDREETISHINKVNNTISDRESRQQTFKSSKKSFLKSGNLSIFKAQPKIRTHQRNLSIPLHNRKKTLTAISPLGNLSPTYSKSRAARRRVMTQVQPIEDSLSFAHSRQKTSQDQSYGNKNQLIAMNKQKMTKFIKNLHKLAWMADYLQGKPEEAEQSEQYKQHLRNFHFDADLPISENKLNYMVARRYGLLSYYLQDHYNKKMKLLDEHENALKRQRFASHKDYPLLEMASKKSILTLLYKDIEDRPAKFTQRQTERVNEEKVSFSLPFSEFISERETKASIYRLVRMSQNSYLKIAFGLYDKNQNGIIDQDDLLQAVSLSRKMPQLQSDLLILCGTFNTPRLSVIRNRQKTISEREKSERGKLSLVQAIKPIEQLQFQSRADSEQEVHKKPRTTTFSLDKFYIFLKEKKAQNKDNSMVSKQPNISFSFAAFCRAFTGHRPAILIDLFQFLLGAQKEDFVETQDIVSIKPSGRFQFKSSEREQTLEQKWNIRIKNTNDIVKKVIGDAKNL